MLNLTSLANLKSWIAPPGNPMSAADDTNLNRLIASASQEIMTFVSRPTFFKNNAVFKTTGKGNTVLLLPQYPVISVTQLLINSSVIPQASGPNASGWSLQPWDGFSVGTPQKLYLNGYVYGVAVSYGLPYMDGGSPYNSGFTRNQAMTDSPLNVEVDYVTGYFVTDEAATVPGSVSYTVTAAQSLGTWGQDDGVKLANGTALVKVALNPAAGQYSVAAGVYTFNAAQASAPVLISYSYIPPSIEQICIEICAEAYSYKSRIGQASQSASGQVTNSYRAPKLNDRTRENLQPYKRMMLLRG